MEWEYVDWIHLPEDTVQWRAAVITVMSLLVPSKARNTLIS